jgi:hypothetical protein
MAAAAAAGALYLDAAVETFAAGSAVRWWTVGAAVLYAGVTATTWRMRLGWQGRLAIGVLGMLGLTAATAWGPGGLTDGIRLFAQPTSRVLALLVAAGVGLAGVALVRMPALPLAARVGVGAVAAYGAGAFLAGAVANTPLSALLGGQSLWQPLPRVLQGAFIGAFVVLPIGLVWSVARAGLRRPRATTWRAELWRLTALTASLAIALAGLPLRSGGAASPSAAQDLASKLGIDPNAPKPTPEALNTALANSLRAIEDGERDMPRDRWDPAYVAGALVSDPERIFTWVKANTFWIPYRGLLRGPVGVLMDRLGNSLDRAVLLATLLRQPGRSVRLAHGTLSEEQAADKLRLVLIARYRSAPGTAEQNADALATLAAEYQLDEASVRRTLVAQADSWTRKRAQLLERVPEQARRLAAAVGQPQTSLTRAAFKNAIDALRDHWWVQVLDAGTWQDFDLFSAGTGTALTSPEQTLDPDSLPDELRHYVTLRVIAEQWNNGALAEHIALERVLRPANLIGTPIVLRFMPANWPKVFPAANLGPQQSLRALAQDQHEWTPTLVVGRNPVTRSSIRDSGDLGAGPEVTGGSGLSGFGRALEDALGPPSGSAAPASKPSSSKVLTSAFVEYEIHAPGGGSRKIRRAVFDLIGPSARAVSPVPAPRLDEAAVLTRSLALMMETDILPVVSRLAPEYLTHLGAQSVLANRELLTAAMRGELRNDFAGAQEVANRLAPMPTPLYGLALARFEGSRFDGLTYIDRPNILTRHTFFAPAQKGFKLVVATDVVANDIGVDVMVEDPFAVRLEQGVLDTNAEAILVSDRPNGSNAGWAYASPGSWTTIRSAGDPQLAALRLPDDVRRRITDDLAAGYFVVAPNSPVPVGAETFSGWWRIDPASGQALGLGSAGWGQEMLEYLITVGTAFALGFMFEYLLCQMMSAGEGPIARGCDPFDSRQRLAVANFFVAPLHAAGGDCASSALLAGALAGLLGAGLGLGKLVKGGGPKGGQADPFAKTQPDLGKTQPDLGKTLPAGRGGAPGGPGGGPAPGGGGGKPGAGSDFGPEFDAAVKRENEAWENFWKEAKGKGIDEVEKMWKDYWDTWIEVAKQGAKPENLDLIMKKGPTFVETWGKSGVPSFEPPPGAQPPTPPAPKGPGGTEIIPPPPTQKMICPGPGCPPSPYEKTQTGLGGVLNTLGQKTGG